MARKAAARGPKSLAPADVARVREYVEHLRDSEFADEDKQQAAMAKAFGVSQPTVSTLLDHRRSSLGVVLLLGIAKHAHRTMDRILGRPGETLAIALDYHRGTAVPRELVDRLWRERAGAELSPEKWWEIIEAATKEKGTGAADELMAGTSEFEPADAAEAPVAKGRRAR